MTVVYLESNLLGSDSLSGSLGIDPISLSGSFQGNATFTGFGSASFDTLTGEGEFQGNATFIGTLSGSFDPTPINGSGVFQGNATFMGSGSLINPDPFSLSGDFSGNSYFSGDGSLIGDPEGEPAIVVNLSATLEGDTNLTGSGIVIDAIEIEEPASCAVSYDIETCSCVTI